MVTSLLIRLFVPDYQKTSDAKVRLSYGILAGTTGGIASFLLFAVTLAVGLFSGSIAVIALSVNYLSDCGAAAMLLIGFKMAAKPADNEHPFGHGRIEYIAGLIVSILIIAVGLDFLKESLIQIFKPTPVQASPEMIWALCATLIVKTWMALFYRKVGKAIASQVILAQAFDSLSDLSMSALVIAAVIAGCYTTFPVNGCTGAVVAALVVWGGIGILRRTASPLLGEKPDPQLVEELQRRLQTFPGIYGIHDIMIHNYGPNRYFASAHVEVSRHGDPVAMHDILDAAEVEIARTMPVTLTLQCDPFIERTDPQLRLWKQRTRDVVRKIDRNFKLYEFHLRENSSTPFLVFDLLIPRNYILSEAEITQKIQQAISQYDPAAEIKIHFAYSYI